MSADGEQVEDDADRIHKQAEDLEQFIRDTLLAAKGSRKQHQLTSIYHLCPKKKKRGTNKMNDYTD